MLSSSACWIASLSKVSSPWTFPLCEFALFTFVAFIYVHTGSKVLQITSHPPSNPSHQSSKGVMLLLCIVQGGSVSNDESMHYQVLLKHFMHID